MDENFLGEILLFAGDYVPEGYLPCDGRTLKITNYVALYSLIGTLYGGDGTQTFKLPDLRNRFVFGGTKRFDSLDFIEGGSETVTINATNFPNHTHTVNQQTIATVTPQFSSDIAQNLAPTFNNSVSAANETQTSSQKREVKGFINPQDADSSLFVEGKPYDISYSQINVENTGEQLYSINVPTIPPFVAMMYIINTNGIYPTFDDSDSSNEKQTNPVVIKDEADKKLTLSSENYVGSIIQVPYWKDAPFEHYIPCDGSILKISDYEVLYSVLGTVFGGDGRTTFGIPNLNETFPVGMGLSNIPPFKRYLLGESGGDFKKNITLANLPPHSHDIDVQFGTVNPVFANLNATDIAPSSSISLSIAVSQPSFGAGVGVNQFNSNSNLIEGFQENLQIIESNTGLITNSEIPFLGSPFYGTPPYLKQRYMICTNGIYPSN